VTTVRAPIRVLTWNLQGAAGLDVAAAAAAIRAVAPDVVALQEVQRRQAARLATVLGLPAARWVFKHWPLVRRAEGLAVMSPHRLVACNSFRVRRAPFWAWRRRVGLDATIDTGAVVVRVLVVHLSPHDDAAAARASEANLLIERAGGGVPSPVIVGDLNDHPGQGAHTSLVGAGWIDAWRRIHGDADGATNWTAGGRVGRSPTQRIDYVLAPSGSVVEDATVLAEPLERMGELSDHLPLVATLRVPEVGRAGR
jgi:endonuclease/exonuclease/phosphatase family metal-dependent hydrolase